VRTLLFAASLGLLAVPALGSARADEVPGVDGDPDDAAVARDAPYRVNLRIGGSSADRSGAPTVCGEVRVWRGLGVESCGTGAQLWHEPSGAEMAHFRGLFEVARFATPGRGRFGLRAGVGFAELAVAVDSLGLQFGAPDATRASAAGPEASLSGQWTRPVAGRLDAIATFTVGAAYIGGAPQLVLPRSELQPFASFEVGLGW